MIAQCVRFGAGLGVALVLACLAGSCGGESGPTTPTTPSTPSNPGASIVAVSVSTSPADDGALTTGGTKQLSALATLASGEHTFCTSSAAWATSNPAVATVSAGGLVAGVSTGSVTISATCAGVTGTAAVSVYRAVSLSGTITDPAGTAVAGALVWARDSKYGKSAKTDAGGRYRIDGIAEATTLPVSVSKDGYEDVETTVTFTTDVVLDVTLRVGFSVGGRIYEAGIGELAGVAVEVVGGPNAGKRAVSTSWGAYTIEHLLPGTFTLRASKPGYDAVEQSITATSRTSLDFTLRSSYGACFASVAPLLFDRFASTGGDATVTIAGNPDRRWTAISGDAWIQVASGAIGEGSGTVTLRVLPADPGAIDTRTGTVRIGCAPDEGQTVQVRQSPDCRATLAWASGSPTVFPAEGGTGHVLLRTGVPNCGWHAESRNEWIHTVGVNDWHGDFEVHFVVRPNTTGVRRTGTLVIGETVWTVEQLG